MSTRFRIFTGNDATPARGRLAQGPSANLISSAMCGKQRRVTFSSCDRRLSAILAAQRACRTGTAADVVLPMARRNPAELLHPDATGEAPLHPAVRSMAVIPAVPSPRRQAEVTTSEQTELGHTWPSAQVDFRTCSVLWRA